MKPGLGRAIPKWVVDVERRQKQKDVNINICLNLNLKSTDLDKNLDIVSKSTDIWCDCGLRKRNL